MGYYTDFKVSLSKPNDEVEYKLNQISGYTFDDESDGEFSLYSAKWYDHEENMIELSELFPDILFTVEGNGEEHGDIWQHFFKNGKHYYQSAKIVFDEFNPSLLTK